MYQCFETENSLPWLQQTTQRSGVQWERKQLSGLNGRQGLDLDLAFHCLQLGEVLPGAAGKEESGKDNQRKEEEVLAQAGSGDLQ